MKKIVSVLLTLCVVMACMFTAVACNNNNNNNQNSSTTSTNSENSNNPTSSTTSENSSVSTSSSKAPVWNSIKSTDRPAYTPEVATDYHLGTNDGTAATTVFLVGDSTVCQYGQNSYKIGYGMKFADYLKDNVTVKNLALSGRSSKSFLKENNYQTFKSEIKAGDYLVIGFGHNDEKKEDDRYTNPNSAVIFEDSFKYHLYEYYIKVALDAGATPILCTPIVRRSPKGNYTGQNIHITSGTGDNSYEGGDYYKAIVELGKEKGITVIDLMEVTKAIMIAAGNEGSAIYYGKNDNTHLNHYGASTVAYNFMLEITKTENTLKHYVDQAKMVAPTAPEVETPTSASTSASAAA